MMKAFVGVVLCLILFGCAADRVDMDLVGIDEEPITEVTVTEDCDDGGTYQLTARVDTVDDPPLLDLDVAYVYTACVDKDGTYNGTVSYGKLQSETALGTYATEIDYTSALTYDAGSCNATFDLTSEADKPVEAEVAGSCPHPGARAMANWEKKCKLKGGKKGKKKKGKCSLTK